MRTPRDLFHDALRREECPFLPSGARDFLFIYRLDMQEENGSFSFSEGTFRPRLHEVAACGIIESMNSYPDGYVYSLTITNDTLWDLTPARIELDWGVWCRGGVDGEGPAAVPAGATVEALRIRASRNNTKGYAFRCAWESGDGPAGFPDAVTVSVHVPLMAGGNRAGLDVSGRLKASGWSGVSRLEHGFSQAITVQAVL